MSVKWKTTINKFPKMTQSIETLGAKSIEVGAIKGEHSWLAGIHEYGADIKPGKGKKFLTVPIHPQAVGKRAGEIPGLFFYEAKTGNKFLAKGNGEKLELYYWLTPSVHIPERSFLRASHDAHAEEVIKNSERALGLVAAGEMSVEQYLDMLGRNYTSMVKDYIVDLDRPPNNPITIENKGSSNPLVSTSGLVESISYRIKKSGK